MEKNHPRLIAAAIKYGGLLFTGQRHGDCLPPIFYSMPWPVDFKKDGIMGFIDETGKFYNRREAASLAVETGQATLNPVSDGDALFSEDLW